MNNSIVYGASCLLAVGVGLLVGYTVWHNPLETASASPAGTTVSTAKYSAVVVSLASPGANATSSSVLNNSANDLYITGIRIGCEGLGTSRTAYSGAALAALTVSAATTSTASPAAVSNTNTVGGGSITIATSTPYFTVSSTTSTGGSGAVYDIWAAGSYLTFTTNATNTAACTFGVDAITS